jgi:hypothetical protein
MAGLLPYFGQEPMMTFAGYMRGLATVRCARSFTRLALRANGEVRRLPRAALSCHFFVRALFHGPRQNIQPLKQISLHERRQLSAPPFPAPRSLAAFYFSRDLL